jgi:hypothetical protein
MVEPNNGLVLNARIDLKLRRKERERGKFLTES